MKLERIKEFLARVFLKRLRQEQEITDVFLAQEGVGQAELLVRIKRDHPDILLFFEHKLATVFLEQAKLSIDDPGYERKLTWLQGKVDSLLSDLILEIHSADEILKQAQVALKKALHDAHKEEA